MTKQDLILSSIEFKKSKPTFLFAATSFEYPYQRGFFIKSNNIKLLNNSNYFKRTQDLKTLYRRRSIYWGSEKSWKREKMIFGKKSESFI